MSKEDMSGLDDTFNTDAAKAEVIPKTNKLHLKKTEDDVIKDYEYARGNLYSLIDKGQEAVNGALDLAMSSDHPRAYEVAGQLIKHVGDVADKLMALQKDKKNVKEESVKTQVTNNSLFVGSTADLQKMLKQASKKKDK
jgi:hypothetical protein